MREYRVPVPRIKTPAPIRRAWLDARILLGARLWLFLAVDAIILVQGFFSAVSATRGDDLAFTLYRLTVLVPLLLLLLPALAGTLAADRRAGALDLALSARSTERFFLRRSSAIAGFVALQSVVVTVLIPHPEVAVKLRAVLLALAAITLLWSIVLFWAARLGTSGGVLVASLASVLVLSRFVFFDPYPPRFGSPPPRVFEIGPWSGVAWPLLQWLGALIVLLGTATIFYAYARRRLKRPELLLGGSG